MTEIDQELVIAGLSRVKDVKVERNAAFGERTTYRVGGDCAVGVTCKTAEALSSVLALTWDYDMFVLGNGSNTLVADQNWHGIVIALDGQFNESEVAGNVVKLGSSVSLPVAARQLSGKGLSGFEWAVGIPGTVGGAVKMNAGGHGSDTANWLKEATVFRLTSSGYRLMELRNDELELRYRTSGISDKDVVISGKFELEQGDPEMSLKVIKDIVSWRRENQPGGQNAGSVFTNPVGDHAARLIESVGLKGFRLGSAEVSPRHANFIQADRNGSGNDVFNLIWHVQAKVEKETGVRLRTEIKLVGFDRDKSRYLRGEI